MPNDEQARHDEVTDADSESVSAAEQSGSPAAAGSEAVANVATGVGEGQSEVPIGEQPELTSEERLQKRVEELETELARVTDALLRKSADFENYRKRTLREKEEFVSYANRELLLDIVAIVDDFERAIRSADESQDFAAFHDGILLIERQFTSMLERKWKLYRFDSVGEEFDPQRHEAMMTEARADHDQSMVIEDFQKGYMLHEKVLRPAKVKVSMPAAPAPDGE